MAAPDPAPGYWCVALNDTPFDDTPTWTRMDTLMRVAQVTIERGASPQPNGVKQTQTGTAQVLVNDTGSLLDGLNTASSYYDKLVGKQTAISEWDPVANEWKQLFQGIIDEILYDVDKSQKVTRTTVVCVDRFDYLANLEMVPDGSYGDTVPAAVEGDVIFYEDANWDDRIIQLLTDAGIPALQQNIFSGNVTVQETLYDSGDDVLGALWDAADAEFPDLANIYCDKYNRVTAHGRFARIDPIGVSSQPGVDWDYNVWKAGDGAAIALDSTRAQIRPPLAYRLSRKDLVNVALAAPRGISPADMAGQLVFDATSITRYGPRPLSRTLVDLITLAGTTTGDNMLDETKRFATYFVENRKALRPIVTSLTFKPLHPTDPRAAATWALMLGIEIGDSIDLETTGPGGVGGFAEELYVDGLTYVITDLSGDGSIDEDGRHHNVTLEVQVSPADLYTYDAFT